MYKFSIPMPYDIESIEKVLNINKDVAESKISTFYFGLPSASELFTGFEQYRNRSTERNWDYWKKIISFSLQNDFNFVYLLNNPRYLDFKNSNFENQLENLDLLLVELKKLGVKNLRIAEHKLISYIEKNYSYFNIYSSTSFEFKTLPEYRNFLYMHPYIKQIVPSHDCIKNFTFLKNLKKLLSNTEIELMVNEGCIRGCPNRIGHASEYMENRIILRNDDTLSNRYYQKYFCFKLLQYHPAYSLVFANNIFPWEIKEYAKLGITNFKFVGRDSFLKTFNDYIEQIFIFLKGIENIKNVENIPIGTFIHHLSGFNNVKVKDIKKYLPDIKYFKKKGEYCAVNCGIECNYCHQKAKRIEELFNQTKKEIPICIK